MLYREGEAAKPAVPSGAGGLLYWHRQDHGDAHREEGLAQELHALYLTRLFGH
jgi:hypothetical protein